MPVSLLEHWVPPPLPPHPNPTHHFAIYINSYDIKANASIDTEYNIFYPVTGWLWKQFKFKYLYCLLHPYCVHYTVWQATEKTGHDLSANWDRDIPPMFLDCMSWLSAQVPRLCAHVGMHLRTNQIFEISESKWPKRYWRSRSVTSISNTSYKSIPWCMFGANLVIPAEICDKLSCDKVKKLRTDGLDTETQVTTIPLRTERQRG